MGWHGTRAIAHRLAPQTPCQDVTLRLIAERLLPDSEGQVYISGELINEETSLPLPRSAYTKGGHSYPLPYAYHLYVSPHNPGAIEFTNEMTEWLKKGFLKGEETRASRSSAGSRKTGSRSSAGSLRQSRKTTVGTEGAASRNSREENRVRSRTRSSISLSSKALRLLGASDGIQVTEVFEEIEQCESMLCYLNGLTWTRGAESDALSREIAAAFAKGVPLLLVHEMPGGPEQVTQ